MSVHIGPMSPDDRHIPRSLRGDVRGRYRRLSLTYTPHLFDYAQGFLGDQGTSADVVEGALAAAAAHFDRARLDRAQETQPGADQAGADKARAEDIIRPWLYAAVRRECVARQADRTRGVGAGDAVGPGGSDGPGLSADEVLDTGSSATGSARAREAVAEALTAEYAASDLDAEDRRRYVLVVMQVLGGLNDADVEVLSLAVRHGLSESDLSTVFAVPTRRAHAELSEAAAKFVQLAATTVLLSAGWSGCRKLDRLVGGSYPSAPDEPLCRRITRHSKSCATCGPIVAIRGFGPELLSVLPIPDLPPAVAKRLASAPSPDTAPAVIPVPPLPSLQSPGLAGAPVAPPTFPAVAGASAIAGASAVAGPPAAPGLPDRTAAWAGTESVQREDADLSDLGSGDPGPDDQGRDDLASDYPARDGRGRPGPDAVPDPLPRLEPWLTRTRAGVLSAAAVVVIVGGAVTASRLAANPSGGSGRPAPVTTTQAPGSQPSGTAPAPAATTAHATSSAKRSSTAQPARSATPVPTYYPVSSAPPTSSPKPKPSSPKPKPSSPKPKPSSSSPSTSPSTSTSPSVSPSTSTSP